MLKIRLIGSEDCPVCSQLRKQYTKVGLEFDFFDADVPGYKEFLDAWGVHDMPVLQIVDDRNVVRKQFPFGRVSPRALRLHMNRIEKELHGSNPTSQTSS